MKKTFLFNLAVTIVMAIAALAATTQTVHAGGLFADQEIEPRFRAKIMKEKAKQNVATANEFNFNSNSNSSPDAQCGSQNIGNVDTGGKIGTAPREVFVFAPNSINLVTSQACK
jgi:hypothetical protein